MPNPKSSEQFVETGEQFVQPGEQFVQPGEQFVQLLISHQNQIYAFILSLLGDPNKARDVVQETNLVLWRKSGEYQLGTSFVSWAIKVAHFQVLNYCRGRQRDRLVFGDSAAVLMTAECSRDIEDLDAREDALRECMNQIGPQDRQAINKRYSPGGSVKNLANELGRTPVATAAYLMRLRKKLFKCMQLRMAGDA